jgi:putative endopeptidase
MSFLPFPRRVRFPAALAAVALFVPGAARAGEHHGIDPTIMDTSVKPTTDFYRFANGKWLDKAKIPADLTGTGVFQELYVRNQTILHRVAEKAAQDLTLPADSPARKVGDFYRVGMDVSLADRLGVTPLAPELQRIAGIQDTSALMGTIASLQKEGIGVGFGVGARQDAKNSLQVILQLSQGGIGLPDRDYYLRADDKSQQIRRQYTAHVAHALALAGDPAVSAPAEADSILALETRLAKASMTRVERRDPNASYHKMTLTDLQAQTPGVDWTRYFTTLGKADPGDINMGQPVFFKEFAQTLADVPLDQWKAYLRWHLLRVTSPYLSKAFVDEDFDFNRNLSGQKQLAARWKRVLSETNNSLGEALGQLYVAQAFPPQARQHALDLVLNLKSVLRDRLQTLDWMSDTTRAQAVRKLDAIRIKIGYPDKWRDYSALTMGQDSYVQNVLHADAFEVQRQLNKIGRPVDHDEWGMTPPTVNAYYNPSMNEIVFPAGILQPPFFDPKADDASNYGAIGVVIGHEMTHGFDDQGRQFDAEGNLKDWWTPEDAKRFSERSSALAAQYSGYVAIDDLHVNGKLTLGENIADLGGVTVAYQALEKTLAGKRPIIDGFTPEQRFFLAFAQVWRSKLTPERTRLLVQTDPHSPARWRVFGPLANTSAFQEAFGGASAAANTTQSIIRIW